GARLNPPAPPNQSAQSRQPAQAAPSVPRRPSPGWTALAKGVRIRLRRPERRQLSRPGEKGRASPACRHFPRSAGRSTSMARKASGPPRPSPPETATQPKTANPTLCLQQLDGLLNIARAAREWTQDIRAFFPLQGTNWVASKDNE